MPLRPDGRHRSNRRSRHCTPGRALTGGESAGGCVFSDTIIAGNPVSGFSLRPMGDFGDVVTIRAELGVPSPAVGIFFPGNTTFSAYSAAGALLGTETFSGSGFFIGFVSDVGIATTLQTRDSDIESCQEFLFGTDYSVPTEVSTWGLVKDLYR